MREQKIMRIAIFSETMDRSAMGTALYTRKLVEGLIALRRTMDFELFLIHRKATGDDLYTQCKELFLPEVRIPKLSRILSDALFLWRTRNDFDVILYPQESIYPAFVLSHARIFVTVHSHIEGWRDYGAKTRYRMVYVTLKFFGRYLEGIFCDADTVKESILRFTSIPASKIHRVPLGIAEIFRHAPDKVQAQDRMKKNYAIESPYILVPSRLDPQKNVLRIIQAYAQLKETNKISHTLVVGSKHSQSETKRVEEFISTHDLAASVVFMPYIENEDMPALYAAADMSVFVSLHEGFGLPILEAMASGTPVVTSNVFSMPEVSGGAALLVNPERVEEITDAMRRLLDDTDLRHDLIQKGKLHAQEYSWDKMAHDTAVVLQAWL